MTASFISSFTSLASTPDFLFPDFLTAQNFLRKLFKRLSILLPCLLTGIPEHFEKVPD
jgi:hypothetical protein